MECLGDVFGSHVLRHVPLKMPLTVGPKLESAWQMGQTTNHPPPFGLVGLRRDANHRPVRRCDVTKALASAQPENSQSGSSDPLSRLRALLGQLVSCGLKPSSDGLQTSCFVSGSRKWTF